MGDAAAGEAKSIVQTSIDWRAYMARHAIMWDSLPKRWLDAPFMGNGMMGAMVFQSGESSMRFQVGRGDVQDHRPLEHEGRKSGTMYSRNRLPIGYFELKTVGKITGGTMKLDLWNAEVSGVIETEKGKIHWRSFVPSDHMLIVHEIEPTEGEADAKWEWRAETAVTPRGVFRREKLPWYKPNPKPVLSEQGEAKLCTQKLLFGGETVTAWLEENRGDARVLMISVAHTGPQKDGEKGMADEALGALSAGRKQSMDELVKAHRAWWHKFYPESFVSFPDAYWERFYWMQMYKLASGTRDDRMLLDLNGPWLQRTPWPGIWWNLNVQLTYWPTYGSNRLHLGWSLNRTMYANVQNLIDTVPEKYRHDSAAVTGATGQDLAGEVTPPNGENAPQMGLLLWALHNCWLHYRHSMNDEELREHLYPLLKRATNYYFHFMTEDEKGVLHIPQTFSPEYKAGKGPDTNFDLALLKWGCHTLIQSAERLKIEDPLLPKWKKVVRHLRPFPVNENGFMIAADVPFKVRHRHYSHLLMIYPLYLVNAEQEGAEKVAMTSLKHWQSFGVKHGYALTGASSIASAFGHGNDALAYLEKLKRFVSVTTMYSEIGPWAQCIETPLSGAQSIHDMLLQSWGGTIRVFPSVADAWADVAYHDMRAEGAFLVSAVRKGGKTQWVRIKSLAGEPCRVKPGLVGEVKVAGGREFALKPVGDGVYEVDLKKGEEALLYVGKVPEAVVAPVDPVVK